MALCRNDTVGSGDGMRLLRHWRVPKGTTIRANLFICHGTHEHSGRYHELAAKCCRCGVSCHALDFRGHGQSGGARGDIGGLDGAIDDVVSLVASVVASSHPALPIVLLGHSLGSMIAMLASHKLANSTSLPTPDAVILSGFAMDSESPPFGIHSLIPLLRQMPAVIRAICGVLSVVQPSGPACPLPTPSELTHCPAESARCAGDPFHYHGWIQNRTALCLLVARARCKSLLQAWGSSFPFLLIHGGADTLCPRSACDSLLAASPQPDKELQLHDGLYHEALFETAEARERVHTGLLRWLQPRLETAKTPPLRSKL
jgi:acylglycerol lipase